MRGAWLRATGSLNSQIAWGTPVIWQKAVKNAPLSVLAGFESVKKYEMHNILFYAVFGRGDDYYDRQPICQNTGVAKITV